MRTMETLRHDLRLPSERELQVVAMLAAGASNDEIARDLGLRPKTVESHLRTLFDRYGLVSRTELAMHAVNEGWIRRQGRSPGRPTGGDVAKDGRWMADRESLGAVRGNGAGKGVAGRGSGQRAQAADRRGAPAARTRPS